MTQQSHLYPGFIYARVLPSIIEQRKIECSILRSIPIGKSPFECLLSIGPAYGGELEVFLSYCDSLHNLKIDAIDIAADVGVHLRSVPAIKSLENKFSFMHLDVRDLQLHRNYGVWSCIQCGFILEDIQYEDKDKVYRTIFNGLSPGGTLILSEMFIDNRVRVGKQEYERRQKVSDLYNHFLNEAERCAERGLLNTYELHELCGDDSNAGILATKSKSLCGERDFFETQEQIESRLRCIGFTDITFFENQLHPYLGVLTTRRPGI